MTSQDTKRRTKDDLSLCPRMNSVVFSSFVLSWIFLFLVALVPVFPCSHCSSVSVFLRIEGTAEYVIREHVSFFFYKDNFFEKDLPFQQSLKTDLKQAEA